MDAEFTTVLLKLAPGWTDMSPADRLVHYKFLQDLLLDIATYVPLSTETVENKHGILQATFHKFRCRSKSIYVAVEESVLDSVVREHEILRREIAKEELPARLSASLCKIGRRHRAHHSLPPGLFKVEPVKPLEERLHAAAKRQRRRLSGSSLR